VQAVFRSANHHQQQQQQSGDQSDSDADHAGQSDSDAQADLDSDKVADSATIAVNGLTPSRRKGGKSAAAAAADGDSDDGSSEEGGDLDPDRVLMYEKSKLRWYYAVVECDSANVAAAIYEACDGLEFERSASKFDLRWVDGGWMGVLGGGRWL
jgi:hypothetical protein